MSPSIIDNRYKKDRKERNQVLLESSFIVESTVYLTCMYVILVTA